MISPQLNAPDTNALPPTPRAANVNVLPAYAGISDPGTMLLALARMKALARSVPFTSEVAVVSYNTADLEFTERKLDPVRVGFSNMATAADALVLVANTSAEYNRILPLNFCALN